MSPGPEIAAGLRAAPAAGHRRVGRGSLDRGVILGEAVRLIDAYGPAELTMRRLGAVLDVEAMALYRYVPGRESVLDGVVETVMDEVFEHTVALAPSSPGWQGYLHDVAYGVRTVALAHPRVFPLIASRPPEAPWLRPPLRSLRWVEAFLQGLLDRGFTTDQTVTAYRAFSTYLLGHLLLEVAAVPQPSEESAEVAVEGPRASTPDVRLVDCPVLATLADRLSEDAFAEEFETALRELVDRLARDLG